MSFTLIETKTLGTATTAIEFTSIPQTFTDLLILFSLRGANPEATGFVTITMNGSTASITSRYLQGTGSAVGTFTSPANFAGDIAGGGSTANTFNNLQIYIPNYTGATNKLYSVDAVGENNATAANQSMVSGLRSNTDALTSVGILNTAANLVVGSTASLYGILKGSSNGVVVS
jgi:hypothetical protein